MLGSIALMSVDFPTPECPEKRVMRPLSSFSIVSMPSPFLAETLKQG